MQKRERKLTVYGMSGYQYKETPTIMMKGQWLRDSGFEIGNKYRVSCGKGIIILTAEESEKTEES